MIKPLIVQSDGSILLDVHADNADAARDALIPFAELEKSPEHIHTYRLSTLSLWNAAQSGKSAKMAIATLADYSRYAIPEAVERRIEDIFSRFGKIRIDSSDENTIRLSILDERARIEISRSKTLLKNLIEDGKDYLCPLIMRGTVKLELVKLGWPPEDLAPLRKGDPLEVKLRTTTLKGKAFNLREYQIEAARALTGNLEPGSGFGTIVLPCGSGKTVVGMRIMELLKTQTLILAPNQAAVHQWIAEIIDKTEIPADMIGEYSGDKKEIKPVTVATYQVLTWRPDKDADFPHFKVFRERAWGLIIYDEVHLLPAPVFRVTAELQGVRRVGLTATLVREDGREAEVFGLVGPKRYDVPWKVLEAKGFIAEAFCKEVRVHLAEGKQGDYALATNRSKYRIASENPAKIGLIQYLIEHHADDQILIIGEYLSQLNEIAKVIKAPLITGKSSNTERERVYDAFRSGDLRVIVASRVANFAIDLPDASVAIQVSGTFGSRQEEAQRLGRILRPKARNSFFYTVVTKYSQEEEFAANRQKFLAEQGYKYQVETWEDES